MIRDIARRQTETGGEQRAPLKLVGRDVGEPLFQIVAIDGRRATRGRNRQQTAHDDSRERAARTATAVHEFPMRAYYSSRLPGDATSGKVSHWIGCQRV